MDIGKAKSVTACATHGLLSGPAIQRIADSVIDEVVFLDTIPQGRCRRLREDPLHLRGPHVCRGHQPHLRGDFRLPSVLLNTTLPNRRGRASPVSSFLSEERDDHVFPKQYRRR